MCFCCGAAVCFCYLFVCLFSAWAAVCQVVKGATAQAMMNRAAALVKWEGIMTDKTRTEVG